jgi:hypothetical protein
MGVVFSVGVILKTTFVLIIVGEELVCYVLGVSSPIAPNLYFPVLHFLL